MKINNNYLYVDALNTFNEQVTVGCLKGVALVATGALTFVNYGKSIFQYSILIPRIPEPYIFLTAGLTCLGILTSYCGKWLMEYINEREWEYMPLMNVVFSLSCFVHKMGSLIAAVSGIITAFLVFINCIG